MKKRKISLMLLIGMIFVMCTSALAASDMGNFAYKDGNVYINANVSFVSGPLTLQDKYWGNASIYGKDVDSASVIVRGWTEKKTIIDNVKLGLIRKSISKNEVKCGYGQSWGKLSVKYENTTKVLKAND